MQEEGWSVTGHKHLVIITSASLAEDGNRRCCNCLPGLSVRIKQWNFNNDASSQALETPEAAKAVLESSQQGSGVGAASSASKLGVGL